MTRISNIYKKLQKFQLTDKIKNGGMPKEKLRIKTGYKTDIKK